MSGFLQANQLVNEAVQLRVAHSLAPQDETTKGFVQGELQDKALARVVKAAALVANEQARLQAAVDATTAGSPERKKAEATMATVMASWEATMASLRSQLQSTPVF